MSIYFPIKAIFQSGKTSLLLIQASKRKSKKQTSLMKAPNLGKMTSKCAETIDATISIKFLVFKRFCNLGKNHLVFSDQSNHAGLELMGKKEDF